jgi:hypothetical protein
LPTVCGQIPSSAATSLLDFPHRTTQHDPASLSERLRRLRPPRPPLQRLTLVVSQHHRGHRPPRTRHTSNPVIIERISSAGH